MLLGYNTTLLPAEIPIGTASSQFPGWYAVVLDPKRVGAALVEGSVKAVSKTRDGAFRALYEIGPTDRKSAIVRLD